MFHRPRTGLQLHPVTSNSDSSSSHNDYFVESAGPLDPEQSVEAAASPSKTTLSDSHQPFSQPIDTKEAEAMTNTYNNPTYTDNDAGNTVSSGTTAPAFTPAPVRVGMPQQGARSPYGYGQGYSAPVPASDTVSAVSTGRKLVLGEGITMSGEIEACDHLVVEGTVEATLKGASVLEISQSGMFFGAVEINEATIAGRFEGDLVVNGRLTIRATGTVMGTIAYKELAVEAGATIDGKISPMSVSRVATTDKKSSSGKTTAHAGKSESGSELPFSSKSAVAA